MTPSPAGQAEQRKRNRGPKPYRQLVGAFVGAGIWIAVDRLQLKSGESVLADISQGTRSAFYIAVTTAAAALLGFTITATSILLSLGTGPRMTWLREQPDFQQTKTVMMSATTALAATTVIFSILIVVDTGDVGFWPIEALGAAALILVLVRLYWVIWLLNALMGIALADAREGIDGSPKGRQLPFTEPLDDP